MTIFPDSPFFDIVMYISQSLVETGGFLFRGLFYTIDDWLDLIPNSGFLNWLDDLFNLLGVEWLTQFTLSGFFITSAGIWIIITILIVKFLQI